MTGDETGNLIYLVVLLVAVLSWFVASNRANIGKITQQALVWGLIFLGAIAAYGLWDDIRGTVLPRQAVFSEAGRIELPRQPDGHYYLTAKINGAETRFVVDTGATSVVLTRDAARAAGLDPDTLAYTSVARTANGEVRTAPVVIDDLTIEDISDSRVRAFVNDGEMHESLLGMSYLQRFSRIEISSGTLVLER